MVRSPEPIITSRAQEVWLLVARGRETLDRQLAAAERGAGELRASLRALSPASTLSRGYAIAHSGGAILRDAAQAPAGAPLTITLARGSVAAVSEGEAPEAGS